MPSASEMGQYYKRQKRHRDVSERVSLSNAKPSHFRKRLI